jgi:hypothetical protein
MYVLDEKFYHAWVLAGDMLVSGQLGSSKRQNRNWER